jgi:hypothetical protein
MVGRRVGDGNDRCGPVTADGEGLVDGGAGDRPGDAGTPAEAEGEATGDGAGWRRERPSPLEQAVSSISPTDAASHLRT